MNVMKNYLHKGVTNKFFFCKRRSGNSRRPAGRKFFNMRGYDLKLSSPDEPRNINYNNFKYSKIEQTFR